MAAGQTLLPPAPSHLRHAGKLWGQEEFKPEIISTLYYDSRKLTGWSRYHSHNTAVPVMHTGWFHEIMLIQCFFYLFRYVRTLFLRHDQSGCCFITVTACGSWDLTLFMNAHKPVWLSVSLCVSASVILMELESWGQRQIFLPCRRITNTTRVFIFL